MASELVKIFPAKLREKLNGMDLLQEGYTEIRFRCNGPVVLLRGREEMFLHKNGGCCTAPGEAYLISVNEIREIMEYVSNFSVYAYEEELRQGFLTIPGGHRVGICGKVVLSEGKIKTIRNISFLNVRLAREKKGCAGAVLPYLFEGDRLCHTLVVSPPGCGKTTLLRDLIRCISAGGTYDAAGGKQRIYHGRKVGVVDERSELAACCHGVPQNDLGPRTDVLDGCPKTLGIELLLRSMSPEVIAVDELGDERESELIERSVYCGCTIIATVHGEDRLRWFDGISRGRKRIPEGVFERYVFLTPGEVPGKIAAICDAEGREVGPL